MTTSRDKIIQEGRRLIAQVSAELQSVCQQHGFGVADAVARELISEMVAVYVLSTTQEGLDQVKGGKKREEAALRNFRYAKRATEDAVALGVGRGMSCFSRQDIDYTCSLTILPPTVNKEPC